MRRWQIAICFALFVALVAIVVAWEASLIPAMGEVCEEARDGSEHCASYNIFFAVTWNVAKEVDHWSVLLTAIFTGLIAWFTITLSSVSRNQLQHSRAVERAFVFCQDIAEMTIADQRKIPVTFIYRPEWKNSGTTPTKLMTVRTNWTQHHGDLPESFAYAYDRQPEVMFLGPQAVMPSDPIRIPADVIVAAARDEIRIYIWGRVDYVDMFGAPHYSQFCYHLNAEPVPQESYGWRHRTYYGPYNKTDEGDQT